MKQTPMIFESKLTNPSRWFVATRYREKKGVDPTTGDDVLYTVASEKFDITDQITAILKKRAKVKQ